MRFGARGKLFLVSLSGVLVAVFVSGIYLERQLRDSLDARIKTELFRHARTARVMLEEGAAIGNVAIADRLADKLGASTDARVTLIAKDGRVLGDSKLPPREVKRIENHGMRPEVQAALAGRRGSARRYSTTLQTDMLYVAVPYPPDHGGGVVRVAMSMHEVDRAVNRLRWILMIAGLVGVAIAMSIAALGVHVTSRALRQLVDRARSRTSVVTGQPSPPTRAVDEVDRLAGSFKQVAEELDRTISALADERTRFATVLDTASEGVLATDDHQRITLANPAARALLGIKTTALEQPLIEAVRVPALNTLAIRGQTTPTFDEITIGNRSVVARATPLSSGGAVVVVHDVTEMRRLETIRRDFVANVSHELRTPVSVIIANAETLLGGALDDRQTARQFTRAIHRNAERLARLIADLLDLGRIEAGRYVLDSHAVDVRTLVVRAHTAVERAARQKALAVDVAVPADLRVLANAEGLEQVLVNLLENAVKYTPAAGNVFVDAGADGSDHVRIDVRDDGPGISRDHLSRIFERFYRVDPGRSREMGGTGLGLAIVKHLVEAMAGTVGVEPVLPHGSRFWVRLRRAA